MLGPEVCCCRCVSRSPASRSPVSFYASDSLVSFFFLPSPPPASPPYLIVLPLAGSPSSTTSGSFNPRDSPGTLFLDRPDTLDTLDSLSLSVSSSSDGRLSAYSGDAVVGGGGGERGGALDASTLPDPSDGRLSAYSGGAAVGGGDRRGALARTLPAPNDSRLSAHSGGAATAGGERRVPSKASGGAGGFEGTGPADFFLPFVASADGESDITRENRTSSTRL